MKTIKDYEAMTVLEQECFLAHSAADLVHKLYYDNNAKGLEVFCKNLTAILERARDCLDCLAMLQREGDVYAKIYLLLDYMGQKGITEEFVSELTEIAEVAQENFAQNNGAEMSEGEEKQVMKNLREAMNKHEITAVRETRSNPAMNNQATRTAQAKPTPTITQGISSTPKTSAA